MKQDQVDILVAEIYWETAVYVQHSYQADVSCRAVGEASEGVALVFILGHALRCFAYGSA